MESEINVDRAGLDALIADLGRSTRISIHLDDSQTEHGAPKFKVKGDDPRVYAVDADLLPAFAALLAAPTPRKACHDYKSAVRMLRRRGLELGGVDFDTMLAGFLVNPGKPEPKLIDLYHEHLAPLGGNAAVGSEPTLIDALRETLTRKLKENSLDALFNDIELPVARGLADIEDAGIGVDAAAIDAISSEFAGQLKRLERECFDLAGREFNLNSPIQLREVLFDGLKLPSKGLRKTKSGVSTDADTLEKLATAHPLPAKLLEYRTISKLKSTYTDALPSLIDPANGRIHTSFHQAVTATGRLSSTDPNLQNIPTRSEEGRRIRRAFVSAPVSSCFLPTIRRSSCGYWRICPKIRP